MVVYYDEDNFSIKLYRNWVKGKFVDLIEVIPIDELLEVWQKHKVDILQTEYKKWETKPTANLPTENTTCIGVAMALAEDEPQHDYEPAEPFEWEKYFKDKPQTERNE